MNKQTKYIRSWKELAKAKSPTHNIQIDIDGCNGWIIPKGNREGDWVGEYYLSTHTFYGNGYKNSTKILQSCGFNVELANLDEEEQEI